MGKALSSLTDPGNPSKGWMLVTMLLPKAVPVDAICSQQDWTVRVRWQPLEGLLLPLNPTRRGSSLLTISEDLGAC